MTPAEQARVDAQNGRAPALDMFSRADRDGDPDVRAYLDAWFAETRRLVEAEAARAR